MSEAIKISVIVPAYNNAPWLPRCLDSLLGQTYTDLEIIVVDDGSQDETPAVLARYQSKDPRIHPIRQENGGVTSARLHGVREATGAWIGFVDGDDIVEPDMYERLLRNAENHGADISHCGYQMVFEDGRVNYFHNTGALLEHDRDDACKELLSGRLIEPGLCNKLFRASLFQGLEMDLGIKINEDLLMNFLLFKQVKKAVFEDFCPYHYLVRSGSATRRKLNAHQIYDPVRVKEKILALAPASIQREARAAYFSTCLSIYNTLTLAGRPELEGDRKKVRALLLRHPDWCGSRKQQLLLSLIRLVPWAYRGIYGFYAAHGQKTPYV